MRCAVDGCPKRRRGVALCSPHCVQWLLSGEARRARRSGNQRQAKADFCHRISAEERNGRSHAG